jgi:uncharacterized protein (TIGR02996 family)
VDDPTDALTRLAYADWLDERGDPRGAYLRAEREAISGDVAHLRRLAFGLDPVWVARVSLPPVGVCCPHLIFRQRGPELSDAGVAAAEQELGVILPADYKAFLLNYNGGRIDVPFETPEGEPLPDQETEWQFYHATQIWWPKLHPDGSLGEGADLAAWLSRFVSIGQFHCMILLGVSEPDFGQVRILNATSEYAWDFDLYRRGRSAHAATIAALLTRLPAYPRPLKEGW